MNNFEDPDPMPPIYEIDISEGWDKDSQVDILLQKMRSLPFYKEGLMYSGFNGDQIGGSFDSSQGENKVFCAPEDAIGKGNAFGKSDPYDFACGYENRAIAVYNPDKLEMIVDQPDLFIAHEEALIAIIKF